MLSESEIARINLRIANHENEIKKLLALKRGQQNNQSDMYVPSAYLIPLIKSVPSIRALAEHSGVSRSQLYKILNGTQKHVSDANADKILTELGLTHLLGTELAPLVKIPKHAPISKCDQGE